MLKHRLLGPQETERGGGVRGTHCRCSPSTLSGSSQGAHSFLGLHSRCGVLASGLCLWDPTVEPLCPQACPPPCVDPNPSTLQDAQKILNSLKKRKNHRHLQASREGPKPREDPRSGEEERIGKGIL